MKEPKKQQDAPFLKNCSKCMKFFTNEVNYETHIKIKHENQQQEEQEDSQEQHSEDEQVEKNQNKEKKAGGKSSGRGRIMEIQRNQLEDNIYTFLGELGEKHAEPAPNRLEIINFSNDQKLTGQTNYSVNKVIRTPYQEPIKCSMQIPESDIEKSSNKQFLSQLHNQLKIIEAKLLEESQIWELRDPMAPEEEVMDEFSLMDIKKLILNYPKRSLKLEYPHFSIFLLWIGRICKSPAFYEFFFTLGQYIAQFYSQQSHQVKNEEIYQKWKSYHQAFDTNELPPTIKENLKIFDEKSCKKFIEYYVQWADLFRALNI